MSHSADKENQLFHLLAEFENKSRSVITKKDFSENMEWLTTALHILTNKIEIAECQKGKDIIKEEIGDIILQVEKNNDPNDVKYWENLYCELRNAIVRIDTE